MSIFGSIMSKIFGHPAAAQGTTPGAAPAGSIGSTGAAPAGTTGSTPGAAPMSSVDVEAVLKDMSSKAGQPLNYQSSIVDLMKLLNLDSGLGARKELAGELGYTGSTEDSASMNIWLHKQVMQKLAENGGKVPDSLKG